MSSLLLYILCFSIVLLAPFLFWNTSAKRKLPLPPGPPRLPIIGNIHQAPKSHAWLKYYVWGKIYGPVVYLNMLGQPIVVLNTSSAAHDLLAKRGGTFSDRPRFIVAAEMALKGMHMLLRPYDERFKLHQKLENLVLCTRSANTYLPFQEFETKQLLYDLLLGGGGSRQVCHGFFERTTASVIYALFYGFRVKTSSDPVLVAAHSVNHEFDQLAQVGKYLVDSIPLLNTLPPFMAPWKAEAERHWGRQRSLHVGNLQRGYESDGWNFAKAMRNYIDQESIEMPIEELALDVGIMADAALDATTETLMWFVVGCITADQIWVSKAQHHLDTVVGQHRLPTFADRPKLPYIDAIVEEVLRWRPAGPAGVPHYTKVESTYNGYLIPAHSVVIANHWSITRDQSVFGSNVEEFEPERWLCSAGEESETTLRALPTIGFGYGRRACPGQHVARNILWITIARILWAFDIEPGLDEDGKPTIIDSMACTDGLVSKPLPFSASFKPRGDWARNVIQNECSTHDSDFVGILAKIGGDLGSN
ncbi:cytochrome P450 [Periconia macrospinosa]|uniref:Cytochrome P450 n=1 Tax=Periconia macrospinosa TaxID=97972 RepID=A0A2V1DQM5_9PLEO|nr:cytochrome P450 [Periconia macrospinosa]